MGNTKQAPRAIPPRSKRITILVSPAEDAALAEAARQKGVSRSDVLREPLRPYLTGGMARTGTRRDA
jgi:hypothetical protein